MSLAFGKLVRMLLIVLLLNCATFVHPITFSFDSCTDWNSKPIGNCSTVIGQGVLGPQTGNSVHVQNGYLDYGSATWTGCPFQEDSCTKGFAYYGWMKFLAYPTDCDSNHVIASTPVFNLQLLGNGHLAVYAWLSELEAGPNGSEYYAESVNPLLLDVFYPIVVEFRKHDSEDGWRLLVVAQDQLIAGATKGRPRTYIPLTENLIFGGDGVSTESSANVQFDHVTLDNIPRDFQYYYQILFDILTRQFYCGSVIGALSRPLTCYWLQYWPQNWTEAYKSCQVSAYNYGFPYGKLAQLPNFNSSEVWNVMAPKLAFWGNGSLAGYKAWIGAGKNFTWLNETMGSSNYTALMPKGLAVNVNQRVNYTGCAVVDTQKLPWEWSEEQCDNSYRYLCQMSYDCILNNPCKNQGACLPVNDGQNVCKCWPGTSGQFCEKGTIKTNCVNNCTCSTPFGLKTTGRNCTECISDIKKATRTMQEFVLKFKLLLFDIGVDIEHVESWTWSVTSQFSILAKKLLTPPVHTLTNIDSIMESYECSRIWESYSKLLLNTKIYNKYMTSYEKHTGDRPLPSDMDAILWEVENQLDELYNLSCYRDLVEIHGNDSAHKTIVDYCNHLDESDDFAISPQPIIAKGIRSVNEAPSNGSIEKPFNVTEYAITEKYIADKVNNNVCHITQEMWESKKCIVLLV